MIIMHHLRKSRAMFMTAFLEELGLDYELRLYDRNEVRRAPPELREVHPLGKSPVIEDNGMIIAESGVITTYLIDTYDSDHKFAPARANREEYFRYLQWLHYAEGMIMPPINNYVVETILLPPERRNDEIAMRALKLLNRTLAAVEHHMEGRDFLAGDFTIADTVTGHAVVMSRRLGAAFENLPNLSAYADRLEARSAFQTAEAA